MKRASTFVVAVAMTFALAAFACGPPTETSDPLHESNDWREFEGSWNATGTRHSIPLGAHRRGALIDLSGSMLLSGPARPGAGFRSEVIALVDSETGLTGRSVWTDERGDQVWSELTSEGTAPDSRIHGSILGGTGRYSGVTGRYEFTWHSLIETPDGSIQGRAEDFKVRARFGGPAESDSPP